MAPALRAAAVQPAATCVPLCADETTCGTACIPSNTCCATDNAQGFQCKYSIGETCPSDGANCVAARERRELGPKGGAGEHAHCPVGCCGPMQYLC